MPAFESVALGDIPTRRDEDTGADWLPLRSTLGIWAFGINAWRAPRAGVDVIERHDERGETTLGHQEVYLVLEGSARFTIGGEELLAPAGTLVFIEDPTLERVAVAESEGTLVLAVGTELGRAFEVSDWETRALDA